MLNKVLISSVVALACVFAVSAGSYDKARPQVAFIKDGEVIEKREMRDDELEAYHKIHDLEKDMDRLELPLERFEEQIEARTEAIEEAVEAIVENAFDGSVDAEHARELAHRKTDALVDIELLVEQMKPAIEQVKANAKRLESAAMNFKNVMYQDYREDEIDSIRIIDNGHIQRMRFNGEDLDLDLDIDLDFDFDF